MAKDIEVYTLEELGELLQVTRRTLYNWIKSGKLRAFKVGKEWRVTKETLEDFVQTGTEPQTEAIVYTKELLQQIERLYFLEELTAEQIADRLEINKVFIQDAIALLIEQGAKGDLS